MLRTWIVGALTLAVAALVFTATPKHAGAGQWYMGSAEAQRLYQQNRTAFYEQARAMMKFNNDSSYSYGQSYSLDVEDLFIDSGLNKREGGVSYGAIVYGYSDAGDAYGAAWNYRSLLLAHKDAFKRCEEEGGGELCILRHVVRNGCMAVVRGGDQHGFGSGATEAQARDAAEEDCAAAVTCTIYLLECSTARYTD